MSKINLWLDDTRFPGNAPHAYRGRAQETITDWKWAKTVREAKEIIDEAGGMANVDYMALDHDLGWCDECIAADSPIFDDSGLLLPGCIHNGDGTEFVKWMSKTGHWPERRPTVHSFNLAGRRRMEAMIEEHYR